MGAFKLGKMTFGSLFKQPETVKYPFETKPQPQGLKGHIVLDADTCILCGMCDRNCATGCISVDKQARTWSINAFNCIQCGYCITVCPKKCLHMDPDYHPAAVQMSKDVIEVPVQEKAPAKKVEEKKLEPVQSAAPVVEREPETPEKKVDGQLEELLGLMDTAASERVRAALKG